MRENKVIRSRKLTGFCSCLADGRGAAKHPEQALEPSDVGRFESGAAGISKTMLQLFYVMR